MTYFNEQVNRIRAETAMQGTVARKVIRARKYIDHYFASAISLDEIAREAALSKFHFTRLFKLLYGTTPYQYVKTVRVREARKLLESKATVTEACLAVGFESVTSFAGLFKANNGCTPSDYSRTCKDHFSTGPLPPKDQRFYRRKI